MTAYIILDIEVTDPVGYENYKNLATPTVALYGGQYIVRGGKHETAEGEWIPNRLAVLQFENVERAKAWLNSREYAEAKALRHKYAKSKAVIVEGV
ncbi:MAG: hypothetical protein UZ14_CFX002001724 [Chloroflexi bacterium OLB14]|nr:MAG: hypothetical protein UZ14_CFX002001724 [Chloroflexi bacterium OLB14]